MSPIPYGDGREVIWARMPLARLLRNVVMVHPGIKISTGKIVGLTVEQGIINSEGVGDAYTFPRHTSCRYSPR